ncbi:MAG: hypothetical protein QOD75_1142 [Blastocatellia bacterium]|nr:hypothetical protein [Blastocatellia bacterium]
MFHETKQTQKQHRGSLLPLSTIALTLLIFSSGSGQRFAFFRGPNFANASHNFITNQKIVIKNKASNKVLSGVITPGTQVRQVEHTGGPSQLFRLQEAGNGNFRIVSENNLFLSLKDGRDETVSGDSSSSSSSKKVLVFDQRFPQRPACLTAAITANCPVHQIWKINPVANESQVFTIESLAVNVVLQPESSAVRAIVSGTDASGADNQKWILVARDDMSLLPLATAKEISEFKDIVANQSGVAVLSGDTTKPIYYHNSGKDPDDLFYEYRKKFHALGNRSVIGWAPVDEIRRTFCGRVKTYKQCPQNLEHDGTFHLDIDANLHLIPNPKFSFMLKNPKMERYVSDRYFREQVNISCSISNCNIPAVRKSIEDRVREAGRKLLEDFSEDNIEVEFTPAMIGNPKDAIDKEFMKPINPMFSFDPVNITGDACAYGPWMWERLFIADLPLGPVLETFKEDYFNNEIHPANQIWFRKNGTLNLMAVVDQTSQFENPSNPENNTEVHASGLGQRMRFHVAVEIPAAVLNGDITRALEYQVNGKGFKFTNAPEADVSEIAQSLKHKDIVRLIVRDNSFLKSGKTHRVFLDQLRRRPDGSLQGYLVVETVPITRRGGSINVFVNSR